MSLTRRSWKAVVLNVLITSALLVGTASIAMAAPKLKADYRFEGNLKSSVGSAPRLFREGPGAEFLTKRVKGTRQGVWKWPEGTGLRLHRKAAAAARIIESGLPDRSRPARGFSAACESAPT